jgi:hypothetical protein
MTLRDDLNAELAEVQRKLAIVNRVPDDTYSFGTIAVFADTHAQKWHYLKTGEESWKNMQNNAATKPLVDWVFESAQSGVGYFEVYILTVAAVPIFTSS